MSISFVNQSSVSADDFQKATAAISAQIAGEFAASWGLAPIAATIYIQDQPGANDQSGDPGYHTITTDAHGNIVVVGYVFVQLAQQQGIDWRIVASHEGLETAADPWVNSCSILTDDAGEPIWVVPAEVCDATERDSYLAPDGETPLSNFVYRGWFVPGYKGQVDHLKKLAGPLQLAKGGYMEAVQVQSSGWQSFSAYMSSEYGD